jgi:hypothetical protein
VLVFLFGMGPNLQVASACKLYSGVPSAMGDGCWQLALVAYGVDAQLQSQTVHQADAASHCMWLVAKLLLI